jgi:hypothetical protein
MPLLSEGGLSRAPPMADPGDPAGTAEWWLICANVARLAIIKANGQLAPPFREGFGKRFVAVLHYCVVVIFDRI